MCTATRSFQTWTIDHNLKTFSGDDWAVFNYITKKCEHNPRNPNFGTCLLSYNQIGEGTGVIKINSIIFFLKLGNLIRCASDKNSFGESTTDTKLYYVKFLFEMRRHDLLK